MGMNAEVERLIVDGLRDLDPVLIYRFGSYARQQTHSESDVDVAFLSRRRLVPYDVFMCAQQLAGQLHRDVDLVDVSRASAVLKAQVVESGRCLYAESERLRDEFEMYALSDYARANEERREIWQQAGDILRAR